MLDLRNFSCTEDKKVSMVGHNSLDEEHVVLLASSIAQKAFVKMWELDSKDYGKDFSANQKVDGRRMTKTYIEVGHPVKLYNQELSKYLGVSNHNNLVLCDWSF